MNRGVLQSSPVHQIMAAGNPNWWPIAAVRPPSHHHDHHLPDSPFSPHLPTHNNNNNNFLPPHLHPSPFPFSSPSWSLNNDNTTPHQDQIAPDSWTQQLFMSGLVGEEAAMEELVKQENNNNKPCGFVYGNNEEFQQVGKPNNISNTSCWSNSSNTVTATSSPQSCITTFSSTNLMEFSSAAATATVAAAVSDPLLSVPVTADRSSECNSSAVNGGAAKKAKVQNSATQSTFKVRKFGDRITSLHQLVSPFGKTDTASVLLEAIGYIRFLHSQVEALSLPYLSSGPGNNKKQQHPHSVQGERNCLFPEDPGQLLNDNSLKRKGGPDQEESKDLRSKGLCLVPVSSTLDVGRESGADYWAPTLGGFR